MVNNTQICPTSRPQFYWERQSGNLCRMHSLNAYFEAPKFTYDTFCKEIDNYDSVLQKMDVDAPSAAKFDVTVCGHGNLITYILAKNGVFGHLHSFGERSGLIEQIDAVCVFFVFNCDHVWIARKHEGKWYNVDSIGGISLANIDSIASDARLGFIIPHKEPLKQFIKFAKTLRCIVMPDIVGYLMNAYKAKKMMGDAELIMHNTVACLKIHCEQQDGQVPQKINELFANYNNFVQNFKGKNLCSMYFIITQASPIIARIISLEGIFSRQG